MNELDKLVEETAKQLASDGYSAEDFSKGLIGLGMEGLDKTKKKYKPILLEEDITDKFKKVSKIYKVNQTEMMKYMLSLVHEKAQEEKDRRAESGK